MDLEVWYSRVCESASVYLISVVFSCSTLNGLSWKTNFKIAIKKYLKNLLTCFITITTIR